MDEFAPYKARHAEPNGAGDARPTALEIVRDEDLVGKLTGKVALITGCTSGIGVETARALHLAGVDVYITGRNIPKAQAVADDITSDGNPGKVEVIEMELDSLASVRKAAADFLSRSKTLNILITNAGVMACPEGTTQDGFETQFGTNHLGHFLLFQLLKPTLLASSSPSFNSRLVSVSSSGHRINTIQFGDFNLKKQGYTPFGAYGQSKIANVYMANEAERRYGDKGLHATSLHPGGIKTELARHLPAEFTDGAYASPDVVKRLKSVEQGAATSVWAAVGKVWEGRGGKYLDDCQLAGPMPTDLGPDPRMVPGYAPYAYDEEAEKKLWVESLKMVGLEDDD